MAVTDDIRAIANTYLAKVRPSGSDNIMAICPFHVKSDGTPERHPSFAMSMSSGLWFCHACQAKGNLFTFLRDIGVPRDQMELHYSMTIEAARKNMPAAFDPAKPGVFTENPIPESILGLFDYCPTALLDAGFAEETLKRFEIGFDMSHYRITTPIRDLGGELVAISGRSVVNAYPRHKVYDQEYKIWGLPPRPFWDKRSVLWNAHAVYPEIFFQSAPEYIVVVEGFKACMWLWQAGIKNVVALMGTYLSREQKWILERMGAPVYLFLDNNDPGIVGTEKCAEQLRRSLRVHIICYPPRLVEEEKAQPDSLTPDEVLEQKQNARSYLEWKAA
jgi:DNA primase